VDFSLSVSPGLRSVVQGQATTYTVTVIPVNGFTAAVNLSVSGLPAGSTATFSPNPTSSTSTLTITTAGSDLAASYPLSVTGLSGTLTHAAATTLVVTAASPPPSADFSLSVSPGLQSVVQGQATTYTVTVIPVNGFTAAVNLSVSGLPAGSTATFSPNPTSSTSTLTITTAGSDPAASYPLSVTGRNGTLTHAAATTLVVTAASPPPASILLGEQVVESQLDSTPLGQAEAFLTTATATGTVATLSIYLDATSTATRLVAGLYTDANGHPGALLAQGSSTLLAPGVWNSIAIPAVSVITGTRYWIAILGTQSGTLVFRDNPLGTCASETSTQTTLTALPATWTTGIVWGASCPLSAYGSR
jgi:hypothetical protein